MLGIFSCFCCRLLTFLNIAFFQKFLSGTLSECQTDTMRVSICLDPDKGQHSVSPDLFPKYLRRFTAEDKGDSTSKERIKTNVLAKYYLML